MEQLTSRPASRTDLRLCALAHQLNNGLGVIAGHAQLLANDLELHPECASRLRLILQTVEQLASRINGHDCQLVACAVRNENHRSSDNPSAAYNESRSGSPTLRVR